MKWFNRYRNIPRNTKQMTVGELKKRLSKVDDSLLVYAVFNEEVQQVQKSYVGDFLMEAAHFLDDEDVTKKVFLIL